MKKTLLLLLGLFWGCWYCSYAQEQNPENSESNSSNEQIQPSSSSTDPFAPSKMGVSMGLANSFDGPVEEVSYTSAGLVNNTPSAFESKLYGSQQPNLYTGTVSASIPIYTYQDPDFTIPISISYSSNGYLPNVAQFDLGVGWTLNAGGQVVTKVRGIPDYYELLSSVNNPHPGYAFIEENLTNVEIELSQDHNNDRVGYYTYGEFPNQTELEPDIYHFNFMGHSGSFVQTGSEFHVFDTNDPHGEYSIKIIKSSRSAGINGEKLYYLNMEIATGDGYIYVFRQNEPYYMNGRFWGSFWPAINFNFGTPSEYWDLAEIIAPNGRKVIFEYVEGRVYSWNTNNAEEGYDYYANPRVVPETEFHASTIDRLKLKKIIIEDLEIIFDYEDFLGTDRPKYILYGTKYEDGSDDHNVQEFHDLNFGANSLKSIRVIKPSKTMTLGLPAETIEDNGVLKECFFDYEISRGENKVLFLKSVSISGEGSYSMDYCDLNKRFPYYGTYETDHWGFYNGYKYRWTGTEGKDERSGFINGLGLDNGYVPEEIPNLDLYYYSDFDFESLQCRKPNLESTMRGMLTKLTYPTGGYTTFEYELNDYRNMVTRDSSSNNVPYLKKMDKNLIAGGLRVKKITDYPIEGLPVSRTYDYEIEDGISSGNLLMRPYYFIYFHRHKEAFWTIDGAAGGGDLYFWLTSGLLERQNHPYHIEYSCVTERYDNGSYTTYHFADYGDYPDSFRIKNEESIYDKWSWIENHDDHFEDGVDNFLSEVDYAPRFRGTLLSTKYYNNKGNLIKKEEYKYDTRNMDRDFVETGKFSGHRCYIHRTYLESYPLIETKVEEIVNGFPISQILSYQYNDLGQLTRVKKVQSNGDTTYENITYVSDLAPEKRTWVQHQMVRKNLLNFPIAHSKTLLLKDDLTGKMTEQTIAKTRNEYYIFDNGGTPDVVIEDCCGKKIDSIKIYNIQLKKSEIATMQGPTQDSQLTYETVVSYDRYNKFGRLLQKTDRSGLVTSYIWMLDKQFLLAEVVGATYSDIFPDNNDSLLGSSETSLDPSIQNKIKKMPNVLPTFYEFNPYVGITKITTPTGISQGFKYDAERRLIGIYNNDGDVVQTYSYSRYNQ